MIEYIILSIFFSAVALVLYRVGYIRGYRRGAHVILNKWKESYDAADKWKDAYEQEGYK